MPAVTGTLTGPITAAVCPDSVTLDGTVPPGTVSAGCFPLTSPVTALAVPAYTSTAGAAATCRTTSRPSPDPAALVALAKATRAGAPEARVPGPARAGVFGKGHRGRGPGGRGARHDRGVLARRELLGGRQHGCAGRR